MDPPGAVRVQSVVERRRARLAHVGTRRVYAKLARGSAPSALSVLSAFCSRPCFDLRLLRGHREMPKWRQIRLSVVEPTPRSFAASLRCFEKCFWSISSVMPHGGLASPARPATP